MKFNKYEQENIELHNMGNNEVDIKNSLLKIKVKDIFKFLAVLWIIFIGYKGYQFQMSKPVYDVDGITFGLGLDKAVAFPAIMYLILSSRLYKKLKEKFPKLNNSKMIMVSLVIVIIVNNIMDLKLYGSIGGLGGFLIIYIPVGIVASIISIISHLSKRKLKKYLENDSYVETKCDYESNEASNMENILPKCNKCGYENKEGAKFCNQCGSKIEETNNEINNAFKITRKDKTTLKDLILVKHKRISIISLIVVLILFIGFTGYFYYGIGMLTPQKSARINEMISAKNYDRAKEMNNRYFKGTDKETVLIHDIHENSIGLCETTDTGSLEEATNRYKQLKDTVKIIKTDIVSPKYSSNYETIKVTIQNNSKQNLSYVKIGLDFKDKNGKVIQSDWTNSDSVIKPGATQTLEKMVSKDIKYDTVHSEVLDFK